MTVVLVHLQTGSELSEQIGNLQSKYSGSAVELPVACCILLYPTSVVKLESVFYGFVMQEQAPHGDHAAYFLLHVCAALTTGCDAPARYHSVWQAVPTASRSGPSAS